MFGPTSAVNERVDALRQQARLEAATTLYEEVGNVAVDSDTAWERLGSWISMLE
ncbi:hypothetical protein [Streptomyces chryseus]